MEIKAENVARFFYDKNDKLTDKQIQKLTYYAYAWYYTKYQTRLFDESPQAWIHGPVFMSLYKTLENDELIYANTVCIKENENVSALLEIIYRVYGKLSGTQLERLTHSEEPWKKARRGFNPTDKSREKIKDEDILAYYGA